jgi:hypothetical protein
MTPQEANKIIAEFMGNINPVPSNIDELSEKQKKIYQPYAYSLDALVPVWEKMKLRQYFSYESGIFRIYKSKHRNNWSGIGKTIQEAAAIATAKAIEELKK